MTFDLYHGIRLGQALVIKELCLLPEPYAYHRPKRDSQGQILAIA